MINIGNYKTALKLTRKERKMSIRKIFKKKTEITQQLDQLQKDIVIFNNEIKNESSLLNKYLELEKERNRILYELSKIEIIKI